jgi:hypothetical protein
MFSRAYSFLVPVPFVIISDFHMVPSAALINGGNAPRDVLFTQGKELHCVMLQSDTPNRLWALFNTQILWRYALLVVYGQTVC